jgi:hypothetical protein
MPSNRSKGKNAPKKMQPAGTRYDTSGAFPQVVPGFSMV